MMAHPYAASPPSLPCSYCASWNHAWQMIPSFCSTQAVLSFAAIRHADPAQWEHWQAILAKYKKSDLIEYMLRQPMRADDPEWESKAARLIRLALETGLELFHDPDQQGWASVRVDGHWENHPIRSRAFRLFLLRLYYADTG